MIKQSQLEEIVNDQLKSFNQKDRGIARDVDFDKYLKTKQITVISGLRRSGKSTLLAQLADKFKKFYYLNFDDERLIDFKVQDFDNLMTVWQKKYRAKVVFLDEVQNVLQWERFVRRIHDEGCKIFVTGSNAKLLAGELATHLTGRYFKLELYPFSFREFLWFKKIDPGKKDSTTRIQILKSFDEFLKQGGLPEFVKYKDTEFVKRVYEDVLYKDLLTRYKIREVKAFKQLAAWLFANFTSNISYNGIKNILGFKNVMSVKNYIEFMQDSYLIFELYKYDYSLKKQFVSDKKIYVVDNGMRENVAFSFSGDTGRLLENLVFLELKRRGLEIYYFKDKKECDFLVKEKNKITQAIQVSYNLDEKNKKREIGGLVQALQEFKLRKGLILTNEQNEIIKENNLTVEVMMVWQWLLSL